MKFTRSQLIVLITIGVLVVAVFGGLASIVVRNTQQFSQVLAPTTAEMAPLDQVEASSPAPTTAATVTPAPTPTPVPTLTPTPIAPQTRYDLQVAREPESPTLRLQRGYAYITLGAYIYAIEDFNVAIERDAKMAEAYVGRGEARIHLKEWTAAMEDFDQALALNPDQADAHAWRGYLLSERGEHDPALEALRRAAVLDGGDPWKHVLLAQALLRSGNASEAEAEYTVVLLLDPRAVEAYVGRAMARAEQGDFDAAQGDLYSALDIEPYDPMALNGQAWYYAWYRHSYLAEAEGFARRAIEGTEGDLDKARYLHTLGWIYYEWGRYDDAAAVLEEAAGLATVEGEVVYKEIIEHLEEARKAQQ
jgi:tetratricopeptide (TPR) repeat protein